MILLETGNRFPTGHDGAASLRTRLHAAVGAAQAALDRRLTRLQLGRRDDLVRYLGFQLMARAGIEQWLAERAPRDWLPPPQTGLIAADLIAVGGLPAAFAPPCFRPEAGAHWVGPAYVLAGSHLGNRLLMAQAGEALPGHARLFLTGTRMQTYWRRLRGLVADAPGPDGGAGAAAGAAATLAHFLGCAARLVQPFPRAV